MDNPCNQVNSHERGYLGCTIGDDGVLLGQDLEHLYSE
jgi:hypothetical protein